MREINGDAVRRGEVERAAGVVAVLVGDEDAVDFRWHQVQASEPALRIAQVEAAVEEQARAADLGHQAVALAAAR